MKNILLKNFKEIILADDIKYLRFEDEKSDKLYLVEDYNDKLLEEKMEDLLKLDSIDEVLKYFSKSSCDTNIFEFVDSKNLKDYKNEIKNMPEINKQKLTTVIKEVKNLKIKYINFTYFFFETEDGKLYFVKELKNGNLKIKNLKIENVIIPTDINVVMRDIKAYGAFKFRGKTIKYDDVKCYIENPMLSLEDEQLRWVLDKIKQEQVKKVIDNISKSQLKEEKKDIAKPKKNASVKNDSKSKTKKVKTSKDNILFYCLIGFTVGVLLAAITIVVGSYM